MTITREILSKEAGFVEGVVVECICHDCPNHIGIFHGILYTGYIQLEEYPNKGVNLGLNINRLVSIRPLTGPLAHWSLDCVPGDAEWSVVFHNRIDFLMGEDWESISGIIPHKCQVSRRPWWCGRKGREDA